METKARGGYWEGEEKESFSPFPWSSASPRFCNFKYFPVFSHFSLFSGRLLTEGASAEERVSFLFRILRAKTLNVESSVLVTTHVVI